MKITSNLTDEAVLAELGARIARLRLERNISQAELGDEAGVGRRTVQRLEAGHSVQSVSLIRVLRVLGLMEGLERLVPEPAPSPLQRLQMAGRARQRASGGRSTAAESETEPWRWSDDHEVTG